MEQKSIGFAAKPFASAMVWLWLQRQAPGRAADGLTGRSKMGV